jgi:hypothetical protein
MSPKYPQTIVALTDCDGNAFAVLGCCRQAAQQAELPDEVIATFKAEAMAIAYDHLLQIAMRWFDVR